MAYKEDDDGYIECPNCDIFHVDDIPCPLCTTEAFIADLLKENSRLRQQVVEFREALEIVNKAMIQEFDEKIGITRPGEAE